MSQVIVDPAENDQTRLRERSAPARAPSMPELGHVDAAARPNPPVKAPKRPLYRRPAFWVVAALLVAGVIIATIMLIDSRHYESTDDAFIEGHIVQMSPQIAASVQAVHVNDNDLVKKGDLLVELDPTDYRAALDQARGNEGSFKGKLQQAKAQVTSAQAAQTEAAAELEVAQANYDIADQDLKRWQSVDERARSKQQLDQSVAGQKSAKAQVSQAKAKIAAADSQIVTAQAAVAAAEGDVAKAAADVHRAQVNLDYARITAPSDGRITRKNVEPGSYVIAGQPLFALVPTDVWVVANFKETQLARMEPGQPVTISIDAYPDHEYRGKVDSIQSGTGSRFSMLPAENATGNYVKVVQRVPVKINLDPGQQDARRVLAPGMSAEPKVKVR